MSQLSIKASHNATVRRFSLTIPTSFASFHSHLASVFSLTSPFSVFYVDDENDLVSVSSETELSELFAVASSANLSPLRMHIYDSGSEPSSQTLRQAAPQETRTTAEQRDWPQTTTADETPQLDNILSGVAHVLSAMRVAESPSRRHRHRPSSTSHGCAWETGRLARRSSAWAEPLDTLASLLSQLSGSSGGGGGEPGDMLSRLREVSHETRAAVAELVGTGNRDAVLRAARAARPVAREWIRTRLGEDGGLDRSAVDDLVRGVEHAVRGAIGPEVTRPLTRLLRTALGDEAVVGMLRAMPEEVLGGAEAGRGVGVDLEGGDRAFMQHRGVECDACGKVPIVGSRYVCTNVDEYDLCGACYESNAVSKEGLQFRECRYVWEKELGDALVPPAPLRIGGRGPRVALLQKRLAELGFLNETLNMPAIGRFGPNTRMAVLQFQREYGLANTAMEGVYDGATAAKLVSLLEERNTAAMS